MVLGNRNVVTADGIVICFGKFVCPSKHVSGNSEWCVVYELLELALHFHVIPLAGFNDDPYTIHFL